MHVRILKAYQTTLKLIPNNTDAYCNKTNIS